MIARTEEEKPRLPTECKTRMQQIRRVCVYCGSSGAVDDRYRDAASELGRSLAAAGIGVVFGGGRIGLMGLVADAALAAGGHVIGVIPAALRDRELAHQGVSELVIVGNMHERKRRMTEKADAVAVLPGGIGTLDETFESLTWRQLGLHDKPIFLVDVAGYWQPLAELLDHIVGHGFAAPLVPRLIEIVPDVAGLMTALAQAAPGSETRSDLL
jgi:uncharacterized protein (TIGR00730 family)